MTILQDEIPFTNSAIRIYVKEAEKRMKILFPNLQEYRKLKRRIKMAQKRLQNTEQNTELLIKFAPGNE